MGGRGRGRGVRLGWWTEFRELLRCLAWNGRSRVIGFASGELPVINVNQTILEGSSILGVADRRSSIAGPVGGTEDFGQLSARCRQGLVRSVIGHRFPLADAAAMRVVFEPRSLGKVVIEMPT